ncbi:hypothetical protein [Paraburkholderia sp. BCC1886]|uniref:hypothetical protein n=1 Tax=Paraburkholderia sp. BCC1886 TaxID=2562670 RepID=UPI0021B2C4EF|nr:hypothetical protein [Paraburkholderia sp. BCC1886]
MPNSEKIFENELLLVEHERALESFVNFLPRRGNDALARAIGRVRALRALRELDRFKAG